MEAGASKKEAKAAEAKSGDDDLSMEEILQSIRRIIADDDTEGKKVTADSGKANGAKGKGAEEDVPGSDVLELTEMLKDDGTVVNLKNEPPAPKAPPAAPEAAAASPDILNTIDQALTPEKPAEKTPEKAAEKPAEKPLEKPEPMAAAPMPEPKMEMPKAEAPVPQAGDALLSSEAAAAAAEALKRLRINEPELPPAVTTPAPVFRSGTSVEDMVAEMLRPMLKQWLDANLPHIVERIVEREVRKLSK